MATVLKYFAYGSNLHPVRFRERIPSCRLLTCATLPYYAFEIHKRGMDGSAKCNAHFTGVQTDHVLGVIYLIHAADKESLDHFEDEGRGYSWAELEVVSNGTVDRVYTYLATERFIEASLKPFDWYKDLVLLGMQYHRYPMDYMSKVKGFQALPDPDRERALRHRCLNERLRIGAKPHQKSV